MKNSSTRNLRVSDSTSHAMMKICVGFKMKMVNVIVNFIEMMVQTFYPRKNQPILTSPLGHGQLNSKVASFVTHLN
jgi:hypothetical protein